MRIPVPLVKATFMRHADGGVMTIDTIRIPRVDAERMGEHPQKPKP
jgi:hypothetical protein